MVYVKKMNYSNASRVIAVFTFLFCMGLLSSIVLLQVVLWHKLSSKLLPYGFMSSGLSKLWLMGHICSLSQPFAACDWSQDLLLSFFRYLQFFHKKLFLSSL